jgi:hypothetical protein
MRQPMRPVADSRCWFVTRKKIPLVVDSHALSNPHHKKNLTWNCMRQPMRPVADSRCWFVTRKKIPLVAEFDLVLEKSTIDKWLISRTTFGSITEACVKTISWHYSTMYMISSGSISVIPWCRTRPHLGSQADRIRIRLRCLNLHCLRLCASRRIHWW